MTTPSSVTVGASERSAVSDLSSSPAASASPPTVTDAVSLAAAAVQELTGALEAAKELAAKASASRELAERAALREHEAQEVEDAVRADVDASFPTVGAAEEQRSKGRGATGSCRDHADQAVRCTSPLSLRGGLSKNLGVGRLGVGRFSKSVF